MSLSFGSISAPSNVTTYLDALFAQSLALYGKKIIDNISASNAFLYKMIKSDWYESAPGGTYIAENLLYALAVADSFDGYDELGDTPTDGVGQAQYEWRQLAAPIIYSMREVIQNQQRLTDLVKTKIQQGELGIQEGWAQAFFNGAGNGSINTPKISTINGSQNIEPIGKIIQFNPSASALIGNIDQSTSTFWRNQTKTSAATTLTDFLFEMENLYNTCTLGAGGPPDLLLMDQVSYELFNNAYFLKWRRTNGEDSNYPFENTKFKNATVVMEDKVPDAFSSLISTSMVYGSAYFLNTKFFRVRYHEERNWEMLKDENGKTFAKPLKGDSRLGHMSWMGNVTCKNRKKQGVLAKIARTMTAT